jgi:predicted DNA-binding transcriptional regulator YafY
MRITPKKTVPHHRPKATDTLLRHLTMLRQLPRSGSGISVKEISEALEAEGFFPSKRTIERDLNELSTILALECNDKSKPHGWRWKHNADTTLAKPSTAEALAFSLVDSYLKPLLPRPLFKHLDSYIESSRKVLNGHNKSTKAAKWTQKIRVIHPTLNMIPAHINERNLTHIQEALLNDWQLDIIYQSLVANEEKNLVIHPLALVQRGSTSYIVATAFHYSDIRIFAINRIKKAKPLEDKKAIRPDNFDIDAYIKEGNFNFSEGKPTTIKLKLDVKGPTVHLLKESPLADDMTLKITSDLGAKQPTAVIEATVHDSWQLNWWLLSQVATVTVLQPASLRKKIVAQLEDAMKNYSNQK